MKIKRIDTDRYGRTVAEIFIEGTNIQKLMVKNGFAKIHEMRNTPFNVIGLIKWKRFLDRNLRFFE